MTGPSYPLRVDTAVGEATVKGKLPRTGTVDVPVPVSLDVAGEVGGELRWRRWPTEDPWQSVPMTREGDALVAELPPQSRKAAKIEYRLRLSDGDENSVIVPTRLRFKGAVPLPILVVHIFAMFFGMLFSLRAGLEALVKGSSLRWQTLATLVCLGGGGLLLGPIVQRYAFDAYWTGWPVGEDLTDNKLAVAVVFWLIAFWQQRRGCRAWSIVAAVVTFVIFMVPHSLHGSTHDWESGEHIQAVITKIWPLT
jgi:hypothetical protein